MGYTFVTELWFVICIESRHQLIEIEIFFTRFYCQIFRLITIDIKAVILEWQLTTVVTYSSVSIFPVRGLLVSHLLLEPSLLWDSSMVPRSSSAITFHIFTVVYLLISANGCLFPITSSFDKNSCLYFFCCTLSPLLPRGGRLLPILTPTFLAFKLFHMSL